MNISVVVCSHNSRLDYLERVLEALRAQSHPIDQWELVVVDNASTEKLAPQIDLSWHPAGRVVRNPAPTAEAGLVDARVIGMENTAGPIIVFVDDDNVLARDFLDIGVRIGGEHPQLGAWGGQIHLEYENPDRRLPPEREGLLCFRKLNSPRWGNHKDDYESTPWGAGMCIRRSATEHYRERLAREPDRLLLDPRGREMRFGGDTDLIESVLLLGMGKGVFPQLSLTHLIPERRCDPAFILRVQEAHGYSAALHGWLNNGSVQKPRNDWRYWVKYLISLPFTHPLVRVDRAARRRGEWRAYRELSFKSPRRVSAAESTTTKT